MEQDRYNDFNALVSGAIKSMNRIKLKKMAQYGLGSAHIACLLHIHASRDGLKQTEIIELCEVDKAQISRVMAQLSARELVEHSPESGAGTYRKKYILTASGKTVAEDIVSSIHEINRFVSKDIPPEDIAVFYNTFQIIFDNLKKVEEHL